MIKEIIDIDGTWVVDDVTPGRVLVVPSQAWIDKNTSSLGQLKSLKIIAVKKEAENRLFALCPDWKVIRHFEQRETLTTLSISEIDFKNIIQKKEAIRAASNAIETTINNMTTINEISAYDIINNLLWP